MSLSEFEIIQQVFQPQNVTREDVRLGIGDDAAVMVVPQGFELAVSMDTLIEGVHFPVSMRPKDIGYRALAVNLSDLAAMGAEPVWVTLALTIPEASERWLRAFASGFFSLAEQHNIQLIGGDTTCGELSITVQVHGLIPIEQRISRAGAQAGDLIYVTGTLGDAAAGLLAWEKTGHSEEYLKQRLKRPTARVEAGIQLREIANSAIDISDGLAADLTHILTASGVGASLEHEKLPLSLPICDVFGKEQAIKFALTGGDDYELCFTAPSNSQETIAALNKKVDVHQVGRIVEGSGINFTSTDGACYDMEQGGYQHF